VRPNDLAAHRGGTAAPIAAGRRTSLRDDAQGGVGDVARLAVQPIRGARQRGGQSRSTAELGLKGTAGRKSLIGARGAKIGSELRSLGEIARWGTPGHG
jgi:hypothetical protein